MSLCFAMNIDNGVLIAADGRITKDYYSGQKECVFDYHPKLRPLTRRSAFFISGVYEPCEQIRSKVDKSTHDDMDINEVSEIIRGACIEYTDRYKNLIKGNISAICGGILAYFDTCPHIRSFAHSVEFQPFSIDKDLGYGFLGLEQVNATKYLQNLVSMEGIGCNFIDLVFKTFQYASSLNLTIGGRFLAYYINKSGVNLISERMI